MARPWPHLPRPGKHGSLTGMTEHHPEGSSQESIQARRIAEDIEQIGGISECDPAIGYSRPTFSEAWRRARDYVIREAAAVGGETRINAFGNVHIRRPEVSGPFWLCGSHVDSVPSGGKYDGVMGVVVALEVFRLAPTTPLELVIFCEEEGTTFGMGLLGSRAWGGEISAAELSKLTNRYGQSFIDAGAPLGVNPTAMQQDIVDPSEYRGMIEVHAEQGLSLWSDNIPVAAVTRINGRRQYEVRMTGQGNHAGSTRMVHRQDALVGAAEAIQWIEELGRSLDQERPFSVMTVGRVAVEPNAINVIPGSATFSVDARAQEDAILDAGEKALRDQLKSIAANRQLDVTVDRIENVSPAPLDAPLRHQFQEAARRTGRNLPEVPSGALHDAAKMAQHMPAGMLFVASRDGISHDPQEFSRTEDIAAAAEIVLETVRRSE